MDANYLRELLVRNRSYRRFFGDYEVTEETLRYLIELTRYTSSGANKQSLKYILVTNEEKKAQVFATLKWAGYLKDWDGPVEEERPSAYIVILHDKNISNNYFWDHGLAAQTILLGAVEQGLGGCMFASYNRQEIVEILDTPENLNPLIVIAIGKPKEKVVIENLRGIDDIEYYRDSNEVHHVPKRSADELIYKIER